MENREVDGVKLRVLGLEGLLLTKDRADASLLRAAIERLRAQNP